MGCSGKTSGRVPCITDCRKCKAAAGGKTFIYFRSAAMTGISTVKHCGQANDCSWR